MSEASSRLSKFRYEGAKVSKTPLRRKVTKKSSGTNYAGLEDLNPSVEKDLEVLFIGFNPGVESSKQQHHYAHHTNLFWKLFNQSGILLKVLDSLGIKDVKSDPLLRKIVVNGQSVAKADNDFELIKYKIGFTDLVLRCTKQALELTLQEKLDNVPRLLREFELAKPKKIMVIGKGIWEIIVKYIQKKQNIKVDSFEWGLQQNSYTEWINSTIKLDTKIHVVPNTSGLVTSMKYDQKLALWNQV